MIKFKGTKKDFVCFNQAKFHEKYLNDISSEIFALHIIESHIKNYFLTHFLLLEDLRRINSSEVKYLIDDNFEKLDQDFFHFVANIKFVNKRGTNFWKINYSPSKIKLLFKLSTFNVNLRKAL